MINRDEVLDLLDEAIERLPDELRAARWLLKEREEFLAKVRREGDEILDQARARAERMVQRTEVVKASRGRGPARSSTPAEAEARRLRHECEDFCDQKLASFEIVLERTLKMVRRRPREAPGRRSTPARSPRSDGPPPTTTDDAPGRSSTRTSGSPVAVARSPLLRRRHRAPRAAPAPGARCTVVGRPARPRHLRPPRRARRAPRSRSTSCSSRSDGRVTVAGTVRAPWVGECRRCLEEVAGAVEVDAAGGLRAHARPTGETYPLDGDEVDLEPVVRDAVLLALPLAPLCRRGLPGPGPDALPAPSVEATASTARTSPPTTRGGRAGRAPRGSAAGRRSTRSISPVHDDVAANLVARANIDGRPQEEDLQGEEPQPPGLGLAARRARLAASAPAAAPPSCPTSCAATAAGTTAARPSTSTDPRSVSQPCCPSRSTRWAATRRPTRSSPARVRAASELGVPVVLVGRPDELGDAGRPGGHRRRPR